MDIAKNLDRTLTKLKKIPQHLKRVQINETSDYYLPKVINELKKNNRDIMLEILEVFHKHAKNGNVWMLHILTKSNLILKHIEKLEQMKDMVQVEISFTTHDENIRKKLEFFTIPISERLKVISALSKRGIFVRVMAMPFYGEKEDLEKLKKIAFEKGAKAFKNKGLNYFLWDELEKLSYDDLINDRVSRSGSRKDVMHEDLNVKSGETILFRNKMKYKTALMPKPKKGRRKPPNWAVADFKKRLKRKDMEMINCGYSDISNIDWGYIK